MPVEQREKWVADPLAVVQGFFEEGGEWWSRAQEYFSSKLSCEAERKKVPSLNHTPLHQLCSGSLVRYQGMVQDQLGQELCFRSYQLHDTRTNTKTLCCGMYRDVLNIPEGCELLDSSLQCVMCDRSSLYCVPVPGLAPWANEEGEEGTAEGHGAPKETGGGGAKRERSDGDEEEEEMDVSEDVPESKRVKGAARSSSSRDVGKLQSFEKNFPLPGGNGQPCLVKVYGDGEGFGVCSVVEVYGVLQVCPELSLVGLASHDGDQEEEQRAHNPPPSLVPRLHCVSSHVLSHTNPLLPRQLVTPTDVFCEGDLLRVREGVLDVLTHVLLGDRLAAQYTLLNMLSSVYGRTGVMALGKFSVNLTKCPADQPVPVATALYSVFQLLLSKCYLLPLTLENMNSLAFSPRKDYSSNRLKAGLLQLVKGTSLVLDETALQAGRLGEVGVKNLAALGNVMRWQTVSYDFQYHTSDFECDLPIVVCSEGRSILTPDCAVPLSPDAVRAVDHEAFLPRGEHLKNTRQYLTLCQHLEYHLPPSVQKTIEVEFVEMRKKDSTINAEQLHHMLTVSRLLCLSYGKRELSVECWQAVKELEKQRRARLQ